MQENDSIEGEAKMPGSFYISPKWLKNSKTRLIMVSLFWVVTTIYIIATRYNINIGYFLQGICPLIALIAGFERLQQFQYLVKNNQPIITIEEKFIRYANAHEFTILQFEDIETVELKRGLLRKFIKFRFNKKLDDDRGLIADYNKYFSFLKKNRNRKSCKWFIPGFTVEPKELEQAVNFYLQMYRKRQASYPSTWNIPKFLQDQKIN